MVTVADAAEVIRLWPDGPPTVIEGVPPEVEYAVTAGVASGTTFVRNVSDPALYVYAPTVSSNGLGVICVPGGGWTINAWSHEGFDVAEWLTALGYTVFMLKYRVQASDADQAAFEARQAAVDTGLALPRTAAELPTAISDLIATEPYLAARAAAADDGRRAIALAREHAARFGVRADALGMVGFSAGAFMTVDIAMDPRAEQLAWIAPIYGGETCGAAVPEDAPPLFAAVARDDILYKIVEGVYLDWSNADRPCELHVFARGQHGFGMVKQGLPSDRWNELFLAFVEDRVSLLG